MAKKYYVVWRGRNPGIYTDWDSTKVQVDGFQGARFKSYPSESEAKSALRNGPPASKTAFKANWKDFPEIDSTALAVDAACSGNPGDMEYRGVWIGSGEPAFHAGPYPQGTNNIGEFLALVDAMIYMLETDIVRPIYTDSKTGISWLYAGKVRSQLPRTAQSSRVWAEVDRAEAWLEKNDISRFTVRKWDTERWGEIPADFGRK